MSNSPSYTDYKTSTTFRVSDKTPEKHHLHSQPNNIPLNERIKELPPYHRNKCTEILQMSNFPANVYFTKNGFVNTVLDAYNQHYNLVIRPDDVWGAIMTQFSFYINKHAEEFRGKFVNFEGKKQLEVKVDGSLRTAPYNTVLKLMSKEIDRNLVDTEVKKWVLPSFSTTSDNDLVTIGVVFMASMKKYFDYKFSLMCGIPSITLEGTINDWKNVHGRLAKLKDYKLDEWYDMLEPILSQFVDAKQGKVDLEFWQKIAHHEAGGSGPSYISGWITTFCMFDKDGNWRGTDVTPVWIPGKGFLENYLTKWVGLDTRHIPPAIVEVDVIIDDNGVKKNTVMFAGHMATEVQEDGTTVQPTLGWAIALKPDEASESAPEDLCISSILRTRLSEKRWTPYPTVCERLRKYN